MLYFAEYGVTLSMILTTGGCLVFSLMKIDEKGFYVILIIVKYVHYEKTVSNPCFSCL